VPRQNIAWPSLELTPAQWDLILAYAPQGLSVIDLETTGLSPTFSEIIEIAGVQLTLDHQVAFFQELVRPKKKIAPSSTAIHGITNEDVADAAPIEDVLPRFSKFLGETALIAHNAPFDVGHLVFQYQVAELVLPPVDTYCSCRLAKFAFPEFKHHSLAALAENLHLTPRHHHQAFDDALMALDAIIAALTKIKEQPAKVRFNPRSLVSATAQTAPAPLDAASALKLAQQKSFLSSFNVFTKIKDLSLPAHLKDLPSYCEEQAIIKIKFAKGHQPHQWRPVKVTSILPVPQGIALYGLCLTSQMFKLFRIKYIEEIAPLSDEEKAQLQILAPGNVE